LQLLERGYIDAFRELHPEKQEFTFFSTKQNNKEANKGWRLDYFIVDKESRSAVVDSRIHKQFDGSDHVPIELEIDLTKIGNG